MAYQLKLLGVLFVLALSASTVFMVVRAALAIRQGKRLQPALDVIYDIKRELQLLHESVRLTQQDLEEQEKFLRKLWKWANDVDKASRRSSS